MSQWGTCDLCGGPMDMYYSKWCPKCDKPGVKFVKTLNLIRVQRHLVAIGKLTEEQSDELWRYLCDYYEFRNDSNFDFWLEVDDETAPVVALFISLLKEVFGVEGESILLEVSW